MIGKLLEAKNGATLKVKSCRNIVNFVIEELKGNKEEVKRQMSILEYHIKKGQGFALKANNGKYLTTSLKHLKRGEASNFEASKEEVDESCHFFIEKIDKNTIALKTASQIYVSRYNYICNKWYTLVSEVPNRRADWNK